MQIILGDAKKQENEDVFVEQVSESRSASEWDSAGDPFAKALDRPHSPRRLLRMLHRIRNSPRLTIRSTPIYQRIPLPIRLLSSTPAEQLSPLERFSRIPSWKILAALGTAVGIVLIPTWWQSEEEAVPAEHYALLLSECCAAADEVVERATAATLRCIRELMSEIGENATGDNDARVAEAFNKLLQARSLAIEEVFSKVP